MTRPSAIDKFNARHTKASTPQGCWLWFGSILPAKGSQGGYGMFYPESSKEGKAYAHRWAYEHFVGPIPEGLTIDHTCHTEDLSCPGGPCDHRRCVNPDHLEAVPHATNSRRGRLANWHQDNDGRWRCSKGHLQPEGPDRPPQCLECRRDRQEAKKALRRAKRLEQNPELEDVIDELGLRAVAKRLDNGWVYAGGVWVDAGGVDVGSGDGSTRKRARHVARMIEERPDLVSELVSIGAAKVAARLRSGWEFTDDQWVQPPRQQGGWRRDRFAKEHPELIGEWDRIGGEKVAQRLRGGWEFIDGRWFKPMG